MKPAQLTGSSAPAEPPSELQRSLSTFDAAMLVAGNMIGVGIFTTSGYVAEYLQSPLLFFLAWGIGALFAFCGALTYAELATRFPYSGGDYQFLSAAYHPLMGFLFGWSTFTVTYTGSIATIAVGLATYFWQSLQALTHFSISQVNGAVPGFNPVQWLAMGFTLLLTWINTRGVRAGVTLQNVVTVLGLLVLFAFVGVGFASRKGSLDHFTPWLVPERAWDEVSYLGVALVGILFTYTGWTTVVYIAGEVRRPRHTLPRAMASAVLLVAVLYLLINAVYVYAIPLSRMKGMVDIGYQVMRTLLGGPTGVLFAAMIMVQILSSLNSTILSGARIYYAMAREGRFFALAARINRHKVPAVALWLQAGWSCLLIASGGFQALLTYTMFVIVLFSFLSGVALFLFRRRKAKQNQYYPAWGYPVTPLIYLLLSGFILVNTLLHRPTQSLLGLLILLLGLPFYLYWSSGKPR